MKSKFNLSEIMSNAHALFKDQFAPGSGVRGGVKTFAECLREAWRAAKNYIGRSISIFWQWGHPAVRVEVDYATSAAIAAEYAVGGRKYFGD